MGLRHGVPQFAPGTEHVCIVFYVIYLLYYISKGAYTALKPGIGRIEALLLAYLQLRGMRLVEAGELGEPLQLTAAQECDALRRLARGGLIARVRPGLYLVPERLPLGGAWTPDEALAISSLMADCGGTYQVCGPNAFHRHGFSDQLPMRVYAYNDRISGDRTVGAVALTLIKVNAKRLGDVETLRGVDGATLVYASRARTLVDAVYDWSRFNSLPRAYAWILNDLDARRIDAAQLVRTALRFGDMGTRRRLGVLLEQAGAPEKVLARIERSLTPTSSLIPWIPGRPKRGTVVRRWGVLVNGRVGDFGEAGS